MTYVGTYIHTTRILQIACVPCPYYANQRKLIYPHGKSDKRNLFTQSSHRTKTDTETTQGTNNFYDVSSVNV